MKRIFFSLFLSLMIMMITTSVVSAEGTFGTGGRLYFGDDCSVALYWGDPFDPYAVQSITDAEDSAVMESYGGSTLIADHNYQGFDIIQQYGVGSTIKIVDADGNSTTYVCISYYPDAYWHNGAVTLPDGRNAWYGDSSLWLKTCNSDGTNTVSYWVPVWY